jgi:hypothetical protein
MAFRETATPLAQQFEARNPQKVVLNSTKFSILDRELSAGEV